MMIEYEVIRTKDYKRGYNRAIKQGKEIDKLNLIINTLAKGERLATSQRDHPLKGNYKGFRACHIEPDWLLVYKIDKGLLVLVLAQTGKHSDLFTNRGNRIALAAIHPSTHPKTLINQKTTTA